MEVAVTELRRRHPALEVEVLSANPQATAREYGVLATARMDLGAVRRAITAADIVVSGAGGLLQNSTSTRSLVYYAAILRGAVGAGKRAMIFAQSIGPLDLVGRAIVARSCARVDRATVRDERSRELLQRLLPHVPVERTADPAWMLAGTESLDLESEGLGTGSDPLAIVSVRRIPPFDRGIAVIAAAVDHLAALGVNVAFLPLGGPSDAEASTAVIRACKSAPTLLPAYPLAQAVRVIARARVVIGMRLHALILAGVAGVPFLAVPYDPKVAALCEDLGWPLEPLWDPLRRTGGTDREQAVRLVDRLWAEREALRALLVAQVTPMRSLARRNFDVLDDLIRTLG